MNLILYYLYYTIIIELVFLRLQNCLNFFLSMSLFLGFPSLALFPPPLSPSLPHFLCLALSLSFSSYVSLPSPVSISFFLSLSLYAFDLSLLHHCLSLSSHFSLYLLSVPISLPVSDSPLSLFLLLWISLFPDLSPCPWLCLSPHPPPHPVPQSLTGSIPSSLTSSLYCFLCSSIFLYEIFQALPFLVFFFLIFCGFSLSLLNLKTCIVQSG